MRHGSRWFHARSRTKLLLHCGPLSSRGSKPPNHGNTSPPDIYFIHRPAIINKKQHNKNKNIQDEKHKSGLTKRITHDLNKGKHRTRTLRASSHWVTPAAPQRAAAFRLVDATKHLKVHLTPMKVFSPMASLFSL